MTTIFPLSQNAKLVTEDGKFTVELKRFLDGIVSRVGGVNGGIYSQLTYGTTIAWNLDQDPIAVLLLSGNTAITAANVVAGNLYPYRLTLVQDATGGHTVTWGSMFKFPSGTPPALSTGGNAVDELWFTSDGSNMHTLVFGKDIR